MPPARGPNRFLDEIANQIIPQDFLPEDSRVLVGDEKKFVSWLGETYPEFAAEQAGRQAGREEGREEGWEEGFVEALSAATGIGGPAQPMQDVGWEGGFPGGGAGLADPVPTPVPPQFDPAAVPQVAQPEPIPGPMARRIEEGPQPVTLPGPEPTVPVPPPAPMGPLASPVPSALPRPQPTQVPDSVAVEAAVREQAEIARTFAERAQGLPAEGTPPSIRLTRPSRPFNVTAVPQVAQPEPITPEVEAGIAAVGMAEAAEEEELRRLALVQKASALGIPAGRLSTEEIEQILRTRAPRERFIQERREIGQSVLGAMGAVGAAADPLGAFLAMQGAEIGARFGPVPEFIGGLIGGAVSPVRLSFPINPARGIRGGAPAVRSTLGSARPGQAFRGEAVRGGLEGVIERGAAAAGEVTRAPVAAARGAVRALDEAAFLAQGRRQVFASGLPEGGAARSAERLAGIEQSERDIFIIRRQLKKLERESLKAQGEIKFEGAGPETLARLGEEWDDALRRLRAKVAEKREIYNEEFGAFSNKAATNHEGRLLKALEEEQEALSDALNESVFSLSPDARSRYFRESAEGLRSGLHEDIPAVRPAEAALGKSLDPSPSEALVSPQAVLSEAPVQQAAVGLPDDELGRAAGQLIEGVQREADRIAQELQGALEKTKSIADFNTRGAEIDRLTTKARSDLAELNASIQTGVPGETQVSPRAALPEGAVVQPEAAVGLPGPEDVAGPPGRDAARAALETEVAAGAPASRQLALRPAASAADVTESAAAREAIETSAVVERSAALDSGKMPPRRTGGTESPGSPPPPRDPARTLANILEDAPPHERIERTARRRLSASTRITSLELENWVREGEQIARQGKVDLGRITPDEGDALFRVLHGEAPLEGLDARFHPLIEHTRRLRDIEQADMLAFLKEAGDADIAFLAYDLRTMADRMMAIPEYFPRLWKKPGDAVIRARGARGRFGATPSAARGRVDATYSELREAGFEPRSWNPLVMMALRRLEGVNYRTQIMVANGLRRAGKMLPVGEAPEGWRVPKGVGRVFESRPVPRLEGLTREQGQAVREWGEAVMRGQDPGPFPGEVMTTPQLAVPNEIADTLERMFAKPFQAFLPVGRHEIDLARVMDLISNNLKRILFVGSSFQHFDMATRMLGNRFWRRNVYRLGHGGAVRAPGLVANMLDVTFRPGARRALRQQFLSTERIVPEAANSPTWRMLVDEGLNIEGDTQLIAREAMQFMRVVEEQMAGRVVGRALAMFKQMRDYWESGLFEGMYRLGMKDSIENFAAVNVLRQHPDWTARQVAAEIAEIVNTQYSALDLWQQVVFRNPNVQRMAQWAILSTNESDALIRQALNMIPGLSGRNKRIWADWYVGMFVGIAAIANVINFMATGKALPPASYVPVKVDDPYGPFKVGYANSFLSPQIPFIKGRGGEPIYLDMVGQMDTVLRWLVDPVQALANRLNVLPRAVMNQAEGETFFGEKLDTPAKRAVQAAADTITPMFGEQALQIVRGQVRALEEVIPGGETRLGPVGLGVQGFLGLNVRAETTGNILEREARTFTNGERGLEDMRYVESIRFRRQLSEEVKAEFDLRTREQAERGSKFAGYRMRLDDLSGEQIIREASLLRDLFTGRWGDTPASAYWEWRDAYQTVQTEVRRSKRDARREFEIVDRDDPVSVDPLDQALDEYFTIAERAADAAGNFHLDKWVKLLEEAQTGWTEAQREYVEEYRSLREHAPGVSGLLELARPDATGYRAKITASILNRFWRDHREEWEAMLAEVARTPAPVVPVGTPRPAYLDTREESLRLFREQQQRQQQPAGVR